MKNYIITLLLGLSCFANAQVLIKEGLGEPTLEPSAIFEVRDDKRGILFPRVALQNPSSGSIINDQVTVPTPVDGVLVHSTTHDRFMFWLVDRWHKNLNIADAEEIIQITKNFTAIQASPTTISSFPSTMPMFTIGDSTTGWTDLGVSQQVTIEDVNNSIAIKAEGMAAIDNISNTSFQFAIGVFIDDKLTLVRKFQEPAGGGCSWKQFNITGIINDVALPTTPNTPYTIKVMAYNLPKLSNSYTKITYGDRATTNCSNLNTAMAKIVLTATVTQ